jgi:hypothetical protein
MNPPKELLTTAQKALSINLDALKYGTFAEIGAGQEVAREFFHAGGASGTIAKTISAYDMAFSDAIYGKAPRYVSSERLQLMLDHEYQLLIERLNPARGAHTAFFVFADTVSTSNFKGTTEAHGWLGYKFQPAPGDEPSEIVLHVRMWDKEAALQQQALGVVGVNLIYGALYYRADLPRMIESLRDNLEPARIEIDMLRFSGPAFAHVDNRLMSLHLVECGLTNAVMFGRDGDVLQPSEVLHKKAILVERGSFRPPTRVNVDMIECAKSMFLKEPQLEGREVVVLMELTMNNLLSGGALDAEDFLSRVDLLGDIGYNVLISNYPEYYRLTSYFRRYTKEMIGVAMGVNNIREIFDEKYYSNLEGGILEAFGRMFKNSVKLYVYPMWVSEYERYLAASAPVPAVASAAPAIPGVANSAAALVDADNIKIDGRVADLYEHICKNRLVTSVTGFDPDVLHIYSRDVLNKIRGGDASWETLVPPKVAEGIKRRGLFGLRARANQG